MDNERQKLNEKLQEQENPNVESTYLAKRATWPLNGVRKIAASIWSKSHELKWKW